MKNYLVSSGSSHVIYLEMVEDIIRCCCHSGDCDEDIARAMELPEIKSQLDAISEDELNAWWDEFFCDDTELEHRSADRTRKLSWLVFDCAANAVDGDCEEI